MCPRNINKCLKMFSANVRRFPLSSIFTPLNMDIEGMSKPLVYQRIAAVCVLPKSRLLVILTFKFNYLKDQKQLTDQLLYVCTHDYVPKTCVRMLSKPELKSYQQHCTDLPINMISSPDERYLVVYTPSLILFYELVVLQSYSPSSSPLRACKYLAHISCNNCITASGNTLTIDCFDDITWSAIRPCVFVLSFTGRSHIVFTITLKEDLSSKETNLTLIHDDIQELSQNLSALSITNITSTDLSSFVCCVDTINPLESKDGLISKIKDLMIIRASRPFTPHNEKIIVCGGHVMDDDDDKRTPHFTSNFIKCFEVNSNNGTFSELYFLRLNYRNSIFEPIRSAFLFPTMQLSVSPRSVAFPFGLYSIDKQIAKQPRRLNSFKKNLSVCRVVSRNCFNVCPDTSKLSELPVTIYTGYPIVATAISSVSFMSSSINKLHHNFVADSSIDLENFLALYAVELIACADTRGYVHIYLTPLHQHRIFSAKLPFLAEKMTWTTTLNDTSDRAKSVFTLYVIGIADLIGHGTISTENAEATQTTRVLKDVRTIYSIELPIVDLIRIFSVARTTATIQHPVYDVDDAQSSFKVDGTSVDQPDNLDMVITPPLPNPNPNSDPNPDLDLEEKEKEEEEEEEEKHMSLEYSFSERDEGKKPSKPHLSRTTDIKISVKEQYSFYEFPSSEDPPLDEFEDGSLTHADDDQLWSLLPEEEEIAEFFGKSSGDLIEQTTRLLSQSQGLTNNQESSKITINPSRVSVDTIVKDSNPLSAFPTAAATSNTFNQVSYNSLTYSVEYRPLGKIVLPQGEFTVTILSPSDYFSPSLIFLTSHPISSNLLLDAPPVDYITLSDDTFILILSNSTVHLIRQSPTSALSIIDTCSHIFNPHLLVPVTCGRGNVISSVKARGHDRQSFVIKDTESISSDTGYMFIFLKNRVTHEYHILLFRIIDRKIDIVLQSSLCLYNYPEYIYISDNSVQIILSNGSLFILHIQSFLANTANDTTGSAQHILQFTDVSGLLAPIFNVLQTESVLLPKSVVQYMMGRVVARGDDSVYQLASAPLTTAIDISLHYAVLRSSLYKALKYGMFEFETTRDDRLIKNLVSKFQEVYKELLANVFVEISNNDKVLAEKLAQTFP